jgi:hypothetical protein
MQAKRVDRVVLGRRFEMDQDSGPIARNRQEEGISMTTQVQQASEDLTSVESFSLWCRQAGDQWRRVFTGTKDSCSAEELRLIRASAGRERDWLTLPSDRDANEKVRR